MSVPVASVDVPAASDAADPPEDAPHVRDTSHGFRVTPFKRDVVTQAHANSGDVVRA